MSAAGDLDPTFGSGGKYVPAAVPGPGELAPTDIAVQADGKILYSGYGLFDVGSLVRLNANGTLDTTFGNQGYAKSGFGPYLSLSTSVAVGPGGRIAVGGVAGPYRNEIPNQATLVVYKSNGQLDTSFDGDGILNAPQFSRGFRDVIFQSDGKILVAGSSSVVRYDANGTIDKSFGGGDGIVDKGGKKLLIDRNGRIVLLGDYAIFRFNPDGSLDTSFDGDGVLPNVKGTDIALAPDGDILVAGNGPTADLVSRFNSNGSVDLSFGSRGNLNVPGGRQLAVTSGDIYVGSTYTDLVLPYDDFQIRAITQTGQYDPKFPGRVVTDFNWQKDTLVGLALQNGKLIAIGSTQTYNSSGYPILQAALARYDLGTTAPPAQTPFGGTPQLLPGSIGISSFDEGGEGVAYHDSDAINYGSFKSRTGGVDLKYTGNAFHPVVLEMVRAGEWLEYTVQATVSTTYDIGFQASHLQRGGTFHLEVDGQNVTGTLTVPQTGDWMTFAPVVKKGVAITAGTHVLRLVFDTNGDLGGVGNFDNFSFSQSGPANPQQPFRGIPYNDSQRIESEDYDFGGEGIAYHDADMANLLGAHWRDDAVDIETTSDVDGAYNIGSLRPGEWLEYTMNFLQSGPFNLNVRAASQGNSGTFRVMIDGQTVATLSTSDTGGWQSWRTLTKSGVNVAQGQHVVRFQMDTAGSTGYTVNLNWFSFTK